MPNAEEDVNQLVLLYIANGQVQQYNHLGKLFDMVL